jgi:probable DNA repair protein
MLDFARRQLQRLIGSAPVVIVSWPHRDDDAELQPSPLLVDIELRAPDSLRQAPAQSLGSKLFEQRPVPQMLADHYAPKLPSQAARGGSMTIELQSRCAFRAQAQLRLGAEPLQVVSRGIEPRERGNLLHKVLETLWHELGGQQRLLEMDDAQLESLLHEIATRAAATTLQPANRVEARLADLEVRSIVQQVQELMSIERERPPFDVRSAETSERFALGGLFIKLKPDRIDRLADGGDLLVDYKLGESHKPRQWMDSIPGRPRRPQLPLYALAHADSVAAIAFIVAAPGTVEYRGWSDGAAVAAGVDTYAPRVGMPPDWPALLAHWRAVLTALAEKYVAGAATVDPLPQECRTCHLSTLCRVHELGSAAQPEPETDDE